MAIFWDPFLIIDRGFGPMFAFGRVSEACLWLAANHYNLAINESKKHGTLLICTGAGHSYTTSRSLNVSASRFQLRILMTKNRTRRQCWRAADAIFPIPSWNASLMKTKRRPYRTVVFWKKKTHHSLSPFVDILCRISSPTRHDRDSTPQLALVQSDSITITKRRNFQLTLTA